MGKHDTCSAGSLIILMEVLEIRGSMHIKGLAIGVDKDHCLYGVLNHRATDWKYILYLTQNKLLSAGNKTSYLDTSS